MKLSIKCAKIVSLLQNVIERNHEIKRKMEDIQGSCSTQPRRHPVKSSLEIMTNLKTNSKRKPIQQRLGLQHGTAHKIFSTLLIILLVWIIVMHSSQLSTEPQLANVIATEECDNVEKEEVSFCNLNLIVSYDSDDSDVAVYETNSESTESTTKPQRVSDLNNGVWVSYDGEYSYIFSTREDTQHIGLWNGIPFEPHVLDEIYTEWANAKYVIKPDFDNMLAMFVRETGGNPNTYVRDTNGYLSAGLNQMNNYNNILWYTRNNTEITGLKPVAIYREQTISYPTQSQIESALLHYPDGFDPFNVTQLMEFYLTRYQAVGEYYGWNQARLIASNKWGIGGARGASGEAVTRHHNRLLDTKSEYIEPYILDK